METPPINLDIFAILIFLGVIQGLFLSVFFLNKKIRKKLSNLYLGLIMLTLSLVILEIFFVYTGYMYQVLRIDNFSESITFLIGPLIYCYIYSTIKKKSPRLVWVHLLPMIVWSFYCIWYFVQPLELKQISYLIHNFPERGLTFPDVPYTADPLNIRPQILTIILFHFVSYLIISILFIQKSLKTLGMSFFSSKDKKISWLRNFIFLMFAILISGAIVDIVCETDMGTFLIGTITSIVIYATSFNVIRSSDFFKENVVDPFQPKKKYKKSALQQKEKEQILKKLKHCMETEKEFKNNLISLPAVSKKITIPVHHISQVINEKLNMTFFEMIAKYRIEEAKSILTNPSNDHQTIEEIADYVGYNSKSAFNRSFKKIEGVTPSEYKKTNR